MGFLTPPIAKHHTIYDRAKFKLVWYMGIGFFILMGVVTISNFSNPNYTAVPNLVTLLMDAIALFWLYKTKEYKVVCYFVTISSLLVLTSVYYYFDNIVQYTTPMWVMINVLFAFFTLGKRWGFLMLALHFIVIVLYVVFKLESNLQNVQPFTIIDKVNYLVEFVITGAGIGYVLYLFIDTNNKVESKYLRSNNQLEKKNTIISTQNSEKEVMLKEIHHRVKNNLQVISSLLRLQSYSLKDPGAEKEFASAINRVKTMAIIHEIIYQGDNLSNIDIETYMNRLCKELLNSYSTFEDVEMNLTTDSCMFNTKTTVPLALVINELMSNSLEHAFLTVEKPIINIDLDVVSADGFILTYSDNGKWKEGASVKTFGLELIELMTEQLNGKMTVDKGGAGTVYVFEFAFLKDSSAKI